MYTPLLQPVADSLFWSSMIGLLPLITVFVTLGVLKWKAYWAGLAGLGVAALVALLAYQMPAHLVGLSALQGITYGLFPIMWIVVNAIWLYELTVKSGHFEDLRGVIDSVSDDTRIQAVIIAFCFGGLLEALAGFGAPVAITGVMLMAVGFTPLRAACIVLLANTAPVAFGAVGAPIIAAGDLTGISYEHIGAIVGHQTPFIAFVVPLLLVLIADGKRGLKETWPIALLIGIVFGVAQFISANYISVELTDIIAALSGLVAAVIMLRFWKPKGSAEARQRLTAAAEIERKQSEDDGHQIVEPETHTTTTTKQTPKQVFMALFPYLLIIVIFALAKFDSPIKTWVDSTNIKVEWPGLYGNLMTASGEAAGSAIYTFTWLSNPGTLLLISGIIVAAVYKLTPKQAIGVYFTNLNKMKFSILTVAAVLGLAYVMNQSGQTITIGTWIAGTGAAFAFLSPLLGWIGTAVTGSDTSANALFANLQQTAAHNIGLDPALLVAANTSGGVMGKMISPQNLTIAATAVGMAGRESEILRKTMWWSIALIIAMCILVGLQSTVLSWMIPVLP